MSLLPSMRVFMTGSLIFIANLWNYGAFTARREHDFHSRRVVCYHRLDKSGEAEWKISIDEGSNIFKIEERISNKNINIEINPIINQMLEKTYNLENNYSIPMSKLQFDFENEEIMVRLYVNRISGSNRNEITLTNITSDILIKIK